MATKIVSLGNVTHLTAGVQYKNPTWWGGLLAYEDFDIYEKVAWMRQNWTLSIYASVIYVFLIFLGQEVMRHRKAFDLKYALATWNFLLAVFSMRACTIIIPEVLGSFINRGVYTTVCGTIDIVSTQGLYWGYLFVISKMLELGDTIFIVLRKRKLIFLHWYHHISVLICVWASAKDLMSTGAIFTSVNFAVHAIMYAYFGFATLGVKVPKLVSMLITALQLNQMFAGLAVNIYASWIKMNEAHCNVTNFHIWLVYGMYASYAILFGNFFYKTYVTGEEPSSKKKLN